MLGVVPLEPLVTSFVANVLLTVDSAAVFFCLRGVLAVPYGTNGNYSDTVELLALQ